MTGRDFPICDNQLLDACKLVICPFRHGRDVSCFDCKHDFLD